MNDDSTTVAAIRQSLSSGRAALVRWSGIAFALPALLGLVFALRCLGDALSRALGETGNLVVAVLAAIVTTDSALGFFALLGLAGAGLCLRRAIRARRDIATPASDIVVEWTRFTVSGGPLHGLSMDWDELDSAGLELGIPSWLELKQAGLPQDGPDGGRPPAQLRIRTKDGRTVLLGRTRSAEDLDSLRALHELFSNRLSTPFEAPPPPAIVRCGRCGAPVPPCPAASVFCPHCGNAVPVPAEIRTRLEEQERVELPGELGELVVQVSRLPDARKVNRIARRLAICVGATGVLALLAFALFMLCAAPNMALFGLLVVCTTGIVAGASAIGGRYVVDRLVFELVGRRFGARAPAEPGDSWRCPDCGAPLPGGGSPLHRCAYCRAYCVVGMDARLSGRSGEGRQIEEELEAQSLRRSKATRSARVAVAAMVPALAGLCFALAVSAAAFREERACGGGDGRACYEISHRLHSRHASLWDVQSISKSMAYAELSCDARDRCGCDRLHRLAEGELRVLRAFGQGSAGTANQRARYQELGRLSYHALVQPTTGGGECYDED